MKNKQINIIFSVILILTVCVTSCFVIYSHRNDEPKKESVPVNNEITTQETIRPDGFYQEGSNWYYYENGSPVDENDFVFGTVNGEENWWYVEDGKVNFTYNALLKRDENTWWYVRHGKVYEETGDTIALKANESLMETAEEGVLALHGDCQMAENGRKAIEDAIEVIKSKGYDTGFFVLDLNTLKGFSYNADMEFYSASTIKGPYVVSAVTADNSVLQTESSSVDSILRYSSNSAYGGLRRRRGNECFAEWLKNIGSDVVVRTDDYYQYMSPRQLANMWLGNYFFFESGEIGQQLGEKFESPETSPIHSALSETYKTRSKAGWLSSGSLRVTNDAGIVYAEGRTYLISVMTTAPCDFTAVETLVKAIEEGYNAIM